MATSNVKLPELINRWLEMHKKETDQARTKPLDIDAINLTLLLKSMGLRLKYLDFDAEKSHADNLTITVKCNRSGMKAELSYDLLHCSCPEKSERESSFWEVQATGPKVFSKFKNNTSSNLLPDVSESCALVSKAMLSNLLDFYESSIRQVKEEKELAMLHSPLKSPRPKVSVISPGMTVKNPFSTPPAEGKCLSRIDPIPVGSNPPDGKIDKPTVELSNIKQDTPAVHGSTNRASSEGQSDVKSNTSSESVGINNKTHELINSDHPLNKPVVDAAVSPEQPSVPHDHAFDQAMNTLVTSSPNEKPVPADVHHDRDMNVIIHLQQARCQIDMALLLMKLNTTQDISNGSAMDTITPQHETAVSRKSIGTPKFVQPRSSSLLSIERRRSGVDSGTKKKTLASAQTSTPRLSFGSGVVRADTPRPNVGHVKSVAALRKPVAMHPAGSLGEASQAHSGSGIKKPPTGSIASLPNQRKLLAHNTPTSSGRIMPRPPIASGRLPTGVGLIQRSSSASYISKK